MFQIGKNYIVSTTIFGFLYRKCRNRQINYRLREQLSIQYHRESKTMEEHDNHFVFRRKTNRFDFLRNCPFTFRMEEEETKQKNRGKNSIPIFELACYFVRVSLLYSYLYKSIYMYYDRNQLMCTCIVCVALEFSK